MPLKLDENVNKSAADAIFKSEKQILNTRMNLNWESADVFVDNVLYSEEDNFQEFAKVVPKSRKGKQTVSLDENFKNRIDKGNFSQCQYARFSKIDDEREPGDEDFCKNVSNNCRKESVSIAASDALFKFCKTNLLGAPENETSDNLPASSVLQITTTQKNNIEEGASFTDNENILKRFQGDNISKEKQILPFVSDVSSSKGKLVSENKEYKGSNEKIAESSDKAIICQKESSLLKETCQNTSCESSGFDSNIMIHSENLIKIKGIERTEDAEIVQDEKELNEAFPTTEKEWIDSLVFYEDLYPQKPKKRLFHFPKARERFQNIRSQAIRSFRSLASEFRSADEGLNEKGHVSNQPNCSQDRSDQETENEEINEERSEAMENVESMTTAKIPLEKPPKLKTCPLSVTYSKCNPSPNWDDLHFLGESTHKKKDIPATIMEFGRNASTSVRHWYSIKMKANVT